VLLHSTEEVINLTKHKEWTEDEVVSLVTLRQHGMGRLEIGERLKRTQEQVRMKWRNAFGEVGTSKKYKSPEYIASNTPRIGLFDVETLPMKVLSWSMWDQNIGIEQVESGTGLLSWAGKFLNEPEVFSDILTPTEARARNYRRITKSCHEFLSQCDVLIGHNVVDFDAKVIATYFLKYDLPLLKPILIDTLKIARRNFHYDSNKLGFLNRQLGIKEKMANEGFPLWKKCGDGDVEALNRMREYNKTDVTALEELYYKLLPYFPHTFNLALYNDIDKYQCPVCGNTELTDGRFYYTPAGKYETLVCTKCKCVSRKKENLLSKEKRKSLLVNS
jgi:hypothetical protein